MKKIACVVFAIIMLMALAPVADAAPPSEIVLTDQDGKAASLERFKGNWLVVFFGYTSCPDVCPTGLSTMASALDELGPDAAKVVGVFVTVDPVRDTPAVLKEYVAAFHPRIVGLTGQVSQLHHFAVSLGAGFHKAPGPGDTGAISHASSFYLIAPDGKFELTLKDGVSPKTIAARLREYF